MCRTIEEINFFRDCDFENLLWREKLHLVLDLDHTLIHGRSKTSVTLKDKQLILKNRKHKNLHKIFKGEHMVKLRPGVDVFLREASTMFDLSIFTMGSQLYAKQISELLEDCCDNEFRFGKVLSREDCATEGQKSIDVLLSDERVVVIVDDTRQVWMSNEPNLVEIEPYRFFTTNGTVPQGVEVEGEMDEELARVLTTLRSVHSVFYGNDEPLVKDEVDVRKVIEFVRQDSMEQVMPLKRKRSVFDHPFSCCDPAAKRYKTSVDKEIQKEKRYLPKKIKCDNYNVVEVPCFAC